jgi:hypothetical protein
MAWSGSDDRAVWLLTQLVRKCQRRIHRAGRRKYFLVSDHANVATENQIGEAMACSELISSSSQMRDLWWR